MTPQEYVEPEPLGIPFDVARAAQVAQAVESDRATPYFPSGERRVEWLHRYLVAQHECDLTVKQVEAALDSAGIYPNAEEALRLQREREALLRGALEWAEKTLRVMSPEGEAYARVSGALVALSDSGPSKESE